MPWSASAASAPADADIAASCVCCAAAPVSTEPRRGAADPQPRGFASEMLEAEVADGSYEATARVVDAGGPTTTRLVEAALRPRRLSEFPGQTRVRDQLGLVLEAAKRRGSAPDHVLLSGPPGLGKTTLAMIVAAEIEKPIRVTSGPAIQHAGDLAAVLSSLDEGEVLFLDEIHRMSRSAEEMLYLAMEDFRVDVIVGKGPGATAIRSSCPRSPWWGPRPAPGCCRRRCATGSGSPAHLDYYDTADLGHDPAPLGPAARGRGRRGRHRRDRQPLPRHTRASPTGCCAGSATGPRCTARATSTTRPPTRRWPCSTSTTRASTASTAPCSRRCAAGSAAGRSGLSTLAVAVGEESDTVETVAEPYLVREGYIVRTPRGRAAAARAWRHLGLEPPAGFLQQEPSRSTRSGGGAGPGGSPAEKRARCPGQPRWWVRNASPRLAPRPGASGPNHCLPRAGDLTRRTDLTHVHRLRPRLSARPAPPVRCCSIFIVVSQRRRAQQVQALQASLAVGDEVVDDVGPVRHHRRPRRRRASPSTPAPAARCATTGAPSACAPPRSA